MSPKIRLRPLRRTADADPPEPEAAEPAEILVGHPDGSAAAAGFAVTEAPEIALPSPPQTPEPDAPDVTTEEDEPPALPTPLEPEPDVRRATVGDGIALLAAYRRAVLSWVAEDGYPMNVDVEIDVKPAEGMVRFGQPPGFRIAPGIPVAITGSHLRAIPEGGFDERSYVSVFGLASARPRGRFAVSPSRVWVWGEHDLPLPLSYDRRLAQARRYFEADSIARGVSTGPRLSGRLALFRAAHAPFLRATFVAVLLGLAVAVRAGLPDFVTALMALGAAGAVHVGLNISGGLFDLLHSPLGDGRGSVRDKGIRRFAKAGLADLRAVPGGAIAAYAVAATLSLLLLLLRGSPELLLLAGVGLVLAVEYRNRPLRLADHGLGGPAAAIGFGPVLLAGTYAVQSGGPISVEALMLSIPVGLLAGLVVLVNEIPNRAGDARARRRTLPVRWPRGAIMLGFELAATAAFAILALGVVAGWLPVPALLGLLALPMARRVRADLIRNYAKPFELTNVVAANIQLQVDFGVLLGTGYLLTIADQILLGRSPFLW